MRLNQPVQIQRQLQSAEAPDIVASWGAASSAPAVADALEWFAELGWRSENRRYEYNGNGEERSFTRWRGFRMTTRLCDAVESMVTVDHCGRDASHW